MSSESMRPTKSRVVAGMLGILLGALGIHKFYMGYTGTGIVHVVLTVLVITAPVSAIVGLVEGILYLTKTDEDFYDIYVENRKTWF